MFSLFSFLFVHPSMKGELGGGKQSTQVGPTPTNASELGGAAWSLLLWVVLLFFLLLLGRLPSPPLGGAAFPLSSVGWCCCLPLFFAGNDKADKLAAE